MPQEIKTISQRITELEEWLKHNHDNPLRTCVESDLRNLKEQQKKESDASRGNQPTYRRATGRS